MGNVWFSISHFTYSIQLLQHFDRYSPSSGSLSLSLSFFQFYVLLCFYFVLQTIGWKMKTRRIFSGFGRYFYLRAPFHFVSFTSIRFFSPLFRIRIMSKRTLTHSIWIAVNVNCVYSAHCARPYAVQAASFVMRFMLKCLIHIWIRKHLNLLFYRFSHYGCL